MEIVWSPNALKSLRNIFEFIADHSVQNAMQLVNDITKKIGALKVNPSRYNPDKYKTGNK